MAGVNGVEIKVGQRWRTRGGELVTIRKIGDHPDFPVDHSMGSCGRNGLEWGDIDAENQPETDRDLIELVTDEHGIHKPPAPVTHADSAALAEETLVALGWRFDGQTWVEQAKIELIEGGTPAFIVPGYELLADVFHRAYNQAAVGKGKERHANGEPFDEQVMQDGARRFGVGALLFQAFKKSEESQRLPLDRGVNELLGAMVYLAGAVIRREADAAEGGV